MRCDAILARREQRQGEQVALLRDTGGPVVSLTIVSPGPIKDDAVARQAFHRADGALTALVAERDWAVRARRSVGLSTGPELLVALDAPADEVKRALVALEDADPCGRLWDFDVLSGLDPSGPPVLLGRTALGLRARACLLCAAPASACARSRRHPLAALLVVREALATGLAVDPAQEAAHLAVEALLVEARLTPKPGLVDAANTGAHDDMDLPLLERSAEGLRDWFVASWLLGALHPGSSDELVRLGQHAEAAHSVLTHGVNTHRGALYAFGLLLAALGCPTTSEPLAAVSALATPLLTDWLARVQADDSHGSRAYRARGLTGAHGEASSGFATVASFGLPALHARRAQTGDEDDALRWALVSLMAHSADTNLFARGGVAAVESVRAWALDVLEQRPDATALCRLLAEADASFTERRWSPGGSADLLALTWFLDRVLP